MTFPKGSARRRAWRHGGRLSGLALLFVVATGQAGTEGCAIPEGEPGPGAASAVRLPLEAYFFDVLDQNGDRVLSGGEFEACSHCRFQDFDRDGRVSWAEFIGVPIEVASTIERIYIRPDLFVAEMAPLDVDGDGEVSWKEFFNPQMAAFAPDNYDPETGTWRETPPPARAPAPAPRAEAAASAEAGGLPVGPYNCHYTSMMQVIPAGNLISILAGGRYQFTDRGTGSYRLDPATGSLHWLSGPLAGSGVTGEFLYRETDGRPLIRLVLEGTGVNQRGEPTRQTNRCVGPAR